MKTDISCYKDIINLPHHVSSNRPHMSVYDRAAQFSPFSALKGYEEEIDETARFTDVKIELDGAQIDELNEKLLLLSEHIAERPEVKVTYFVADTRKEGGEYVIAEGNVKKIDVYGQRLILSQGVIVPFGDIYSIELK